MLYEPLIDTDSARAKNLSRSIIYVIFGVYLLCYSAYALYKHEGVKTILAAFVMGGFILFASNFSKRYFLANDGVVQSIKSWSGRHDTLLPWDTLELISFVTEGEKLTAYFDNGEKVWKLEFESWRRKDLKAFLKKKLPDMQINEITKA